VLEEGWGKPGETGVCDMRKTVCCLGNVCVCQWILVLAIRAGLGPKFSTGLAFVDFTGPTN